MPTPNEPDQSEPKRALICGASGLVGRECLRLLKASNTYGRVIVLTRRDLGTAVADPKVEQVVIDFEELAFVSDRLVVDDVFCTLGTTIKKAGTKQRFRQIDFGYPLRIAECTRVRGAQQFVVVSSLGADPDSFFFYSRVKGELEQALHAQDWPGLIILQPSIIGGDRDESRPLERIGQRLMKVAPRAWRTVPAALIARAMVQTAEQGVHDLTVIRSREMWST